MESQEDVRPTFATVVKAQVSHTDMKLPYISSLVWKACEETVTVP